MPFSEYVAKYEYSVKHRREVDYTLSRHEAEDETWMHVQGGNFIICRERKDDEPNHVTPIQQCFSGNRWSYLAISYLRNHNVLVRRLARYEAQGMKIEKMKVKGYGGNFTAGKKYKVEGLLFKYDEG